jgi:hypothetical protein
LLRRSGTILIPRPVARRKRVLPGTRYVEARRIISSFQFLLGHDF